MCQKPPVGTNRMVFEHTEFRSSSRRGILLSKRGQFVDLAKSKLAGFILILVLAIVFLAFIGKISMTADDISVEEQCRASVIRNARYHIAGIELGSEIDCPTRSLELKKEDSDNENEKAKEKLARAMYGCWRQFGQGKLNLFNEEKVFCNVCYIVNVNTDTPIKEFTEYLKTTPSPTENEYYYGYLTGYKSGDAGEMGFLQGAQRFFSQPLKEIDSMDILPQSEDIINNNERYAIIFVYARGYKNLEKVTKQVFGQGNAGKFIAPTAVVVGAGVAIGLATAPVSVPAIVIGAGAVAVFSGMHYGLGKLFNADTPPEWASFIALNEWNPYETPKILKDKLGCQDFVETQSN